jgi:large subunit ribosomal protein L1
LLAGSESWSGSAKAKFDETIEIAIDLSVDPRHADQMVRGVCAAARSGRKLRACSPRRRRGSQEGAPMWSREDLVRQVREGRISFRHIAADMMPLVDETMGARPRGDAKPKVGTVTMDVCAAVRAAKGSTVEFVEGRPDPRRRQLSRFHRRHGRELFNLRRYAVMKAAGGAAGAFLSGSRSRRHGTWCQDRAELTAARPKKGFGAESSMKDR